MLLSGSRLSLQAEVQLREIWNEVIERHAVGTIMRIFSLS